MVSKCNECPTNRGATFHLGSTSNTNMRGHVPISDKIQEMLHQKPLVGSVLALDDWGQSPWRVTSIMAQASLMFERESGDKNKRLLAEDAKCKICSNIASMKDRYDEMLQLNGEATDAARKIATDISYCETMLNLIDSQVNGLVSRQRKWRVDTAALDKRYGEEIELRGFWNTLKRHIPWVEKGIGAGIGVAVWASNGWVGIIGAVQFGVAQIMQVSPELQKHINDIVQLVVNLSGILALSGILSAVERGLLKRKQALLDACERKKDAIFSEEKTYRLQLFATIKEKALELCTKYGYLRELEMEDPQYAKLLEEGDFAKIKDVHNSRLKKIYSGGEIPEVLLPGVDIDSHSNTVVDFGPSNP